MAASLLATSGLIAPTLARGADETVLETYFAQLRRRGLYSLAEGYALSRLKGDRLPLKRRTDLTIELSRTLADHATRAAENERADLWQRATTVVEDLLRAEPNNPRGELLRVQAAMVAAAQAEMQRRQAELRSIDQSLRQQALMTLQHATTTLRELERRLDQQAREARPNGTDGLPPYQVRGLLQHVRFRLGQTHHDRAELLPLESPERMTAILDAEQVFRKISGGTDERLHRLAQVHLAELARLRGDLKRAGDMLTAIETDDEELPPEVVEALTTERVRLQLDSHRPDQAIETLLKIRQSQPNPPGELQFLLAQALVQSKQIAVDKRDSALAADLERQFNVEIARMERDTGGYWTARAKQLREETRQSNRYGPELAPLVRKAEAAYHAGQIDEAVQGYAAALEMAAKRNEPGVPADLGYTRGSILLKAQRFQEAAEQFLVVANQTEDNPRAASAHLLAAYCLGRLYDQQRTRERRVAYEEALERHRSRFANDPTAADATWMLAQLAEQRLQDTTALRLYQQIPADHERGPEARAAIARCYVKILRRLEDARQPSAEWRQLAVEQLNENVAQLPPPSKGWLPPQAEVVVHLAEILLNGPRPEYARADELLQQVSTAWQSAAATVEKTAAETEWKSLPRQAGQLRVLSLAGQHRLDEASELLRSIGESNPQEMLAVLDGLSQIQVPTEAAFRRDLAELQLQAAESLNRRREQITADQQRQLDRCLAESYLATNQPQKAMALYERLVRQSPKDKEPLRTYAELLGRCGTKDCLSKAKAIWRKLEGLETPGSVDWLSARFEVARTCLALGEIPECRKLVGLTKLLYPKLGNEQLKVKFAELEAELKRQ